MKKLALILTILLSVIILYNEGDKEITYNVWWIDDPYHTGKSLMAVGPLLPGKRIKCLDYIGRNTIIYQIYGEDRSKAAYVILKKGETILLRLPTGKIEKGVGL